MPAPTPTSRSSSPYAAVKRATDAAAAAVALVLLSPLLLLTAAAIRLDSPGPVLFAQKRIGRGCEPFRMLKFRTMFVDAPPDQPTHLLRSPDSHITRVGRFLRRSSLDELPQLLNILRGDMSFVGPRPALWNQDDLVTLREGYGANDVRPGLTGLAQVAGRDELPIEVKARLDGQYVATMSVTTDLVCVLRTVRAVVTSDGVVEGDTSEAAAQPHDGTSSE